MTKNSSKWFPIIALGLAAMPFAPLAHAACGQTRSANQADDTPRFLPAVFNMDSFASPYMAVSDDPVPAIVGLWKFEMLSRNTSTHKNPMPDGTLIDFGTAAWHGDGTELMNSGSRNPANGDFCQGVWKQVGASTFSLNHMALAWDSGNYVGPAVIKERVTVDGTQQRYAGAFTLTQYLATITPGHEFDQTTAVVVITGVITARRITAN